MVFQLATALVTWMQTGTQSEEKGSSLESEVCYYIAANQIDWSFCCSAIDLFCLLQDSLPQNKRQKCLVGKDHSKVSGDSSPVSVFLANASSSASFDQAVCCHQKPWQLIPWLISLIRLISSQAWPEEEGDACHCPGRWTCDLFNFGLRFKALSIQAATRPSTKVPFAFHFPPDKSGEKTLYIVMLSQPFDISKMEARERDRYKLKANTKPPPREEH